MKGGAISTMVTELVEVRAMTLADSLPLRYRRRTWGIWVVTHPRRWYAHNSLFV